MKNLELNHSLVEVSEEEMESIVGGNMGFWSRILKEYDDLLKLAKGALENPPNLPSATVYK